MPFGQGLVFRKPPTTIRTNRRTFANKITIVRNTRAAPKAVNKVITNRAEKKHNHVSIDENASIDQAGAVVKLSAIGEGLDSHDRIASYARPISLVMRWSMNPGSPNFTLVRMVIFQWHQSDDGVTPQLSDVFENTLAMSNNALFSPYRQDSNNTRVLWDKMSWVAGETGSTQKVLTGKVMIPGSKIRQLRFDRSTVDSGSDMIYMFLISSRLVSDGASLKPNFIAISNIRFTDI